MLVAEELEAKKQKGWRKCWTSANLSQLSPSTTSLSHVQTLARPCCGRSCCQGCNLGEFLMECRKMDGFVGFPFLHICHSKDYDLLTNSGNVISSNLDEKSGWFFFFCLRHKIWPKQPWHSEMLGKVGSVNSLMVPLSWKCSNSGSKKNSEDWSFWRGWPGSYSFTFFFFRRRIGRWFPARCWDRPTAGRSTCTLGSAGSGIGSFSSGVAANTWQYGAVAGRSAAQRRRGFFFVMPQVNFFFSKRNLERKTKLDLESVNKKSWSRIFGWWILGNHFLKACSHSLGTPFLRSQPVWFDGSKVARTRTHGAMVFGYQRRCSSHCQGPQIFAGHRALERLFG